MPDITQISLGIDKTTDEAYVNIDGTWSLFSSTYLADLTNTTDNAKGDALVGYKQSNSSGFLANAVARTVNDKFQEFVSVKDFIPVGTNTATTDCTTYINNALAAATAVDFGDASNTYLVNGTLNITQDGAWLKGEGATIYKPTATSLPAMQGAGSVSSSPVSVTADIFPEALSIAVSNGSSFSANDWILIQSTDTYTTYVPGNYYTGEIVQIHRVDGNTLYLDTPVIGQYLMANTPSVAIIDFLQNITVTGLKFLGSNVEGSNQIGLKLSFVNGFSITNCDFLYQQFHQVNITSSIRGDILGNRSTGVFYSVTVPGASSFYHVVLIDACQWINVGDNVFNSGRAGVTTTKNTGTYGQPLFINVHHNQMFDSSMGDNGSGTPYAGRSNLFQQHGFGRYITINNNFADGGLNGILTYGAINITILDNVITNVSGSGIAIGQSGTDLRSVVVQGNYLSGGLIADTVTTRYGILVGHAGLANMNDVTIANNTIVGFTDASATGIDLLASTSPSYNVTVNNNVVSSGGSSASTTSSYGIAINCQYVTVSNNVVDNYLTGIYIGAVQCLVTGNNIRFGAAGGAYPTVVNYGIRADGADYGVFNNNQIFGAYYGIAVGVVGVTSYPVIANNTINTCFVGVSTSATVAAPAVSGNIVRNWNAGGGGQAYVLLSSGGLVTGSGSATDTNISMSP